MSSENLHSALQSKETEIQKSKDYENFVETNEIIDEDKVKRKIETIENKIDSSALSEKHKTPIKEKLNSSAEEWRKKVEKIDEKGEGELKKLFEEMEKDFDEFESKPEVKDIFIYIEPLFKQRAEVEKIINLKSYSRGSGDWKKMNARLAVLGINEEKINGIQRILGITVDGQVGPETIMAINEKVYEKPFEVKWSDKTEHALEDNEEFENNFLEAEKIKLKEDWGKIDETLREELEKAKTIEDIEKAETKADKERDGIIKIINEKEEVKDPTKDAVADTETQEGAQEEIPAVDSAGNPEKTIDFSEEEDLELTPELTESEIAKEKDFEQMEKNISKDFFEVARRIGLTRESAEPYWNAFLEEPYLSAETSDKNFDPNSKRASVKYMYQVLATIYDGYNYRVSKEDLRNIMQDAFGKMVNGETDPEKIESKEARELYALYQEEKDEEFRKEIDARNEELEAEIEKKAEAMKDSITEIQKTQKERAKIISGISKAVKENPDWYNVFQDSNESEIRGLVAELEKIDTDLLGLQGKSENIKEEIQKISGQIFENEYKWIEYSTVDPATKEIDQETRRAFLLKVGDSMRQDRIPSSLSGAFNEAKNSILNDPNATEFDKLFYVGNYHEALKTLSALSDIRNEPIEKNSEVSVSDIITAYENQKNKPVALPMFGVGYVPEGYQDFTPIVVKSVSTQGVHSTGFNYFLVKENEDGSLECHEFQAYRVIMNSPKPVYADYDIVKRPAISAEEIGKKMGADIQFKENIPKIIQNKPSFKILESAKKTIRHEFEPIMKFFNAGMNGRKTKEFVDQAKEYATKLKGSKELKFIRDNLPEIKADIDLLKSFSKGIEDDIERQLDALSTELKQVTELFKNDQINNFCNEILSGNFNEDTVGRWMIETGIPFLTTLALAVGAVMATVATFGAFGISVGIASVALAGTVGGMVGNELGTAASQWVGRNWGGLGEGFNNKTMLGKRLADEGTFNTETGEYDYVSWGDVVKTYGANFAVGFVSTWALMGAGQIAGKFLSKWAVNASTNNHALIRGISKALQKIPKLGEANIDIGSKKFINKFGRELLEESLEEGMEEAATNINSGLGFIAKFYNCLDGRRVRHNLGGFDVVSERATKTDTGTETIWTYNASDTESFRTKLKAQYGSQGFNIAQNAEGNFVATSEFIKKFGKHKGKKVEIKMVFKSSNESNSMRQMFADGIDAKGESEIERFYGVERVAGQDNEYSFSSLSQKVRVDLPKYLKMRGFVIEGDPNTGEFTAIKGKERVVFKGKGPVNDGSPTKDGSLTKGHNEVQQQLEEKSEKEESEKKRAEEEATEKEREEMRALRKTDRASILEEAGKRDQLISDSARRLTLADVTIAELQGDMGRIDAEIERVQLLLKKHPDINHRKNRGKKIVESGGRNQKWKETRSRLEAQLKLLNQRKAEIAQALEAKKTKKPIVLNTSQERISNGKSGTRKAKKIKITVVPKAPEAVGNAPAPAVEVAPEAVVAPKKVQPKSLAEISEISQLQEWISSSELQGVNPESINESIKNYESTGDKKYLLGIPVEGGLRGKVFELVEARGKQATIDGLNAKKISVKIELAEDVRISETTEVEARDSATEWLINDVADQAHGSLLVQETADNFIDSKPQKLTMNFKNGNRIELIFPAKYNSEMARLQETFLQMETWIQTQFQQQGIFATENLTILVVDDVPGVKPVRGGANFGRILIPARKLFSKQGTGLTTYLHERTHSILKTANIEPSNYGVVEGIAVYMPTKGISELGLESIVRPEKGPLEGIEGKILDRVKYEGETLQEALMNYFGMDGEHDIADYRLNYQYGYAFTEAFIRHFDGDIGKYLDLYIKLNKPEYEGYEHMGALFLNAMTEMGIEVETAQTILGEAAGVMILQGLHGNQLFDKLGTMAVEDIAVIIGKGQSLEAIFDVDLATTAELSSYVSEAKKYITSKFGENSVEGNFIMKMLESKLHQRHVDAGVIEQSTRVITEQEAIGIFQKADSVFDVAPEVLISLPVNFINRLRTRASEDVVFAKKLFGIDPQIEIDSEILKRKFAEFKAKFVTELVGEKPESRKQAKTLMRLANTVNDVLNGEIRTVENEGVDAIPKRNKEKLNFDEVQRQVDVVAIPDTHGDYGAFIGSLRANGMVDANGNWIGGESRIQILGDVFDRGPDSMKILEKIAELKKQGVQVDLLLGNHEDFVLKAIFIGDSSSMMTWFRYGDTEQQQAIMKGKDGINEYLLKHQEAFEVLKTSKIVEQVDDVLYMHGEMSDQATNLLQTHGVDGVNKLWQQAIGKAFEGDTRMLEQVSRDFHPFLWSRAFSEGGISSGGGQEITAHDKKGIEKSLKGIGVNLVVHGHTPQESGIVGKYSIGEVKVINADIALSKGMSEYTPSEGGIKIEKKGIISVQDGESKSRAVKSK